MNARRVEQQSIEQSTVEPRECDFRDCHQPGEHILIGDARLCLVHFLRDRVRLNLARLAS